MNSNTIFALAPAIVLTACATTAETPNKFTTERSVFASPYVAPELDRQAMGPGTDALDTLIYPGRGSYAYDREGNRVSLSPSERRQLRLREEAIADRAEQLAQLGTPPLPPPPPPISPTSD